MLERALQNQGNRLHAPLRILEPFGAPNQSSSGTGTCGSPSLRTEHELLVLDLRAAALGDDVGDAADLPHRSLNLWIFPVAVLGSSPRNSIHRGYL